MPRVVKSRECVYCGKAFRIRDVIDDKLVRLQRRYCLECVPYGSITHKIQENLRKTEKTCSTCGEVKSVDAFRVRKLPKSVGWESSCKKCGEGRTRAYQRVYKQDAVDYKGGRCTGCGYQRYIGALEFHHVDPTEKDFDIGRGMRALSAMKPELDRCVLLCGNCHREEHAQLADVPIDIEGDRDSCGPRCTLCGLNKKAGAFTRRKGAAGSWCRQCFRTYQRQRRDRIKIEIIEYKGGCCQSCHYKKSISALELHHRDPSQKDFGLADVRKHLSLVMAEVDKCILLCTNCHREAHGAWSDPVSLRTTEFP